MPQPQPGDAPHPKLSWREGLYLVGPDPLTSPYYSSGALIMAGVGYATPLFQVGLYALLYALAPLYIEAVLLTLSNGGTYVMTRYALSHLGKLAVLAAAIVGVVISFSYAATAVVSLLSYSGYLTSLVASTRYVTVAAVLLSALPAVAFGLWVMPRQWRGTLTTVAMTTVAAVALSSALPAGVVICMAPVTLLFTLNNQGLRESVAVSRVIFLVNLVVMGITVLFGVVYVITHGADFSRFVTGATPAGPPPGQALPGIATLGAALVPVAIGSSILGALGVESVMNIPEELQRPRRDVPRIYFWMLSILAGIGASVSVLLFVVLPPERLLGAAGYLLAELGSTVVGGVTGSATLGRIWHVVVVANAALMLIGATNTGFAGARGLWTTMARDNLLPRLLLEPNQRGTLERIHWLMLGAIAALCWQAGAASETLERWYGATFGLVMFSGIVAFILLRRFKARDRRVYEAGPNITVAGTSVPIAAFFGLAFLAFALLGLYSQYAAEMGDLRTLVLAVAGVVVAVLLGYNHRPIMRMAYRYFRRVVETVESDAIETRDRTIVVAVGGVRIGRLLRNAFAVAKAQSTAARIPYRQLVVFHMTRSVRREYVYRVYRDAIRPAGIEGNAVRIFTELTEIAPEDMSVYMALVPNNHEEQDTLRAAVETLVGFHEAHQFKGHIVMVGEYGVTPDVRAELEARLEGSTVVWVPVDADE